MLYKDTGMKNTVGEESFLHLQQILRTFLQQSLLAEPAAWHDDVLLALQEPGKLLFSDSTTLASPSAPPAGA